ncbi:MAG: RDD family protein [Traorella sp.]
MQKKQIFSRFLAMLTDLIIILLPLLIWDLIIFIMLAGFLPSGVMSFLDKVIIYVIIVSFCVTSPFITFVYGKTFGQMVFDIRIKDSSKKEAKVIQRVLREFLSGILFLGCCFIYHGLGLLVYAILNLLIILFDKKNRSLVDLICHTIPAYITMDDDVIVNKKKEEERDTSKDVSLSNAFYHYDLHVHSRHSINGSDSVEEIFQKANALGIKVLSITDKYSVKANIEAEVLKTPYHIEYIPGIEMDCLYKGYELSVLGYNIDYKNNLFIQLENEYVIQQRSASKMRVDKASEEIGIDLNFSKLMNQTNSGIVTPKMIVNEILQNPLYEENEVVKKYKNDENAYQHLYADYFGEGKSCNVQVELPDLEEVIQSIKATNGFVILGNPKKSCGDDVSLIKEILGCGFDGIEVFSSSHDANDIQKYLKVAKDLNCFVISGSDYYGIKELMVEIGDTSASNKYEKILKVFVDACLKKVEK